MKHFFGYTATGRLSVLSTCHGGWPECDCRPNCGGVEDASCANEKVTSLWESYRNSDVTGWVSYTCACPSSQKVCNCANSVMSLWRVEDGQLVPKKEIEVFLDDTTITPGSVIDRSPGLITKMSAKGAEIEDGTTLFVTTAGFDVTPEPENTFELTFTGGQTPEKNLVAPAQGCRCRITVGSDYAKGTHFSLRGWTT